MARFRAVVMIHPAGLGGSPGPGPPPGRLGERVLHRVFGGVDVTEDAGQDGHGPAVLGAEDALDVRERGPGPGQSAASS